ncbi:phycocyanobilin lyase HEAT-like repeat protein [Halomicronema hongdechloris C2206]|uniref:Phycocyanobilin lyase HEAT-like repeat protein n=1 Tax=Halomicronema hongdechloris C2206 TaxID=1641165 RepID=A0A1Z3HSJ4_9CYAN|nr:HEAT repeat domain-containing protein [Halomicronema hongdechloris]ASC73274.1 phycocyanobilin lyase HEAT-like repeat protein [Halomicronema hongdechloris C2206]
MSITPESARQLLQSEDFGERLRGVNQLRQLDPAIAFDMVQLAAQDGNDRVRYAAISQLASLGHQDGNRLLGLLRQALLSDPEPDVQAAAADTIGALKLSGLFEDLKAQYYESSEWLVQFSIIAALGEFGDPRAFDLLREALGSDNELVKTAAIGSLGELQDERAIPLLLPFVEDADWQVRHRLVTALHHFTAPEARAALERLTQDESEIVAQAATQHLSIQTGG